MRILQNFKLCIYSRNCLIKYLLFIHIIKEYSKWMQSHRSFIFFYQMTIIVIFMISIYEIINSLLKKDLKLLKMQLLLFRIRIPFNIIYSFSWNAFNIQRRRFIIIICKMRSFYKFVIESILMIAYLTNMHNVMDFY